MAMTENDMKMVAKLQKNLPAIRKLGGWTVREFADKCNVSPQTILNWEADPSKKIYKEMTMGHYWMVIAALGSEMTKRGNEDIFTKAVTILLSDSVDEEQQTEAELKINGIASAIKGGANEETVSMLIDNMKLNRKTSLFGVASATAAMIPSVLASVAVPSIVVGLIAKYIKDKNS